MEDLNTLIGRVRAKPAETDPLREIERLREALKDARQRGGDFAAVWAVVTDALGDG